MFSRWQSPSRSTESPLLQEACQPPHRKSSHLPHVPRTLHFCLSSNFYSTCWFQGDIGPSLSPHSWVIREGVPQLLALASYVKFFLVELNVCRYSSTRIQEDNQRKSFPTMTTSIWYLSGFKSEAAVIQCCNSHGPTLWPHTDIHSPRLSLGPFSGPDVRGTGSVALPHQRGVHSSISAGKSLRLDPLCWGYARGLPLWTWLCSCLQQIRATFHWDLAGLVNHMSLHTLHRSMSGWKLTVRELLP